MFTYAELLDKINAAIAGLPFVRTPKELYAPIAYVLGMEGKRLRPVLMMMAYNLYQTKPEGILAPATGIEIFHNYTLMHDDLMDHADMRRGKPTVHKVWGENRAVLSGDVMLVMAYQWMSKVPYRSLKKVIELFSLAAQEICEGQQMDMEFEHRTTIGEHEYLEMIRLKTAVLLAESLRIGAILGGASMADEDRLYELGIQAGMAFQLKDDWLDVYGDPNIFGKNIGGDILCNKKTYLLIKARQHANATQRAELDRWMQITATDNPAAKIAGVTALYNEIGVGDMTEQAILNYGRQAVSVLEKIGVENERKEELKKIVSGLMHRNV
ncbi:MAG: polyprenyl synthetase family protein [Prevotellaceae bacterium]|jgi:geranylgeranyl diphosphate synthase type II|nr:polyprenyl synthetase family protein [Prevotellaceae bacterium]